MSPHPTRLSNKFTPSYFCVKYSSWKKHRFPKKYLIYDIVRLFTLLSVRFKWSFEAIINSQKPKLKTKFIASSHLPCNSFYSVVLGSYPLLNPELSSVGRTNPSCSPFYLGQQETQSQTTTAGTIPLSLGFCYCMLLNFLVRGFVLPKQTSPLGEELFLTTR